MTTERRNGIRQKKFFRWALGFVMLVVLGSSVRLYSPFARDFIRAAADPDGMQAFLVQHTNGARWTALQDMSYELSFYEVSNVKSPRALSKAQTQRLMTHGLYVRNPFAVRNLICLCKYEGLNLDKERISGVFYCPVTIPMDTGLEVGLRSAQIQQDCRVLEDSEAGQFYSNPWNTYAVSVFAQTTYDPKQQEIGVYAPVPGQLSYGYVSWRIWSPDAPEMTCVDEAYVTKKGESAYETES